MGVGKGEQDWQARALAPPLDFHTLSLKPTKFQKKCPFLVFTTGSILIGPFLKNFLPMPLSATPPPDPCIIQSKISLKALMFALNFLVTCW